MITAKKRSPSKLVLLQRHAFHMKLLRACTKLRAICDHYTSQSVYVATTEILLARIVEQMQIGA